jgi:hypothetical protein
VIGPSWYGQLLNRCWVRANPEYLADRYQITRETLGLRVTPKSPDVLDVEFPLDEVLAMAGFRERYPGWIGVPGQVTVLNGRIHEWTIEGEDLAERYSDRLPRRVVADLSSIRLETEFTHRPTDKIRRPRPDKLATDSGTPCAAVTGSA